MATRSSEAVCFPALCSIPTVERCRQDFLRAFADSDAVAADLSDVDAVDVSFVQLVVSAARTSPAASGY